MYKYLMKKENDLLVPYLIRKDVTLWPPSHSFSFHDTVTVVPVVANTLGRLGVGGAAMNRNKLNISYL